MNAGDTFLICSPGQSLDSHLWIVVSDPELDSERVLIVNITTRQPVHDQTCIIGRGEHPWVIRESCVKYDGAKVQSLRNLMVLLNAGQIEHRARVSAELLARIRAGAGITRRIALQHKHLLIGQGLIPEL